MLCWLLLFTLQAEASSDLGKKTLVVFGDSLSAAYGIDSRKGWVTLLEQKLKQSHPQWQIVNASISGETTSGGLSRLPKVLTTQKPDLLLLELGANDGLRGLPLQVSERNLVRMVELSKQHGSDIFLFEMRIPPNYGQLYSSRFQGMYKQIAEKHNTGFIPFFLDGVAGHPELNQKDGIHPNAKAQPLLMNNVWPILLPALDKESPEEKTSLSKQ